MAKYIDQEAVLQRFANETDGWNTPMEDFLLLEKIIQEAPAADVAPVVHGQWSEIWNEDVSTLHGICPLCGEFVEIGNYCLNCGAKMD